MVLAVMTLNWKLLYFVTVKTGWTSWKMLQLWTVNQGISDNQKSFNWFKAWKNLSIKRRRIIRKIEVWKYSNRTIFFLFNIDRSFALFADTAYPILLVRFIEHLLCNHDTTCYSYRLWKGVQGCVQDIQAQRVSPVDWAGK